MEYSLVCGVEKCINCGRHCTECVSGYRVTEHEGKIECMNEEEYRSESKVIDKEVDM